MKLQDLHLEDKEALFSYALQLGDDALILGHRLSEWCGFGPILEEDLALANLGLDLLGQSEGILNFAGLLEDQGRDADRLAYFREAVEFRNHQLSELPNGDFAQTILRHYFLALYRTLTLESLKNCEVQVLADLVPKMLMEMKYHLEHSSQWIIRLGDGTTESQKRINQALITLWPFVEDLFLAREYESLLVEKGIIQLDLDSLKQKWFEEVGRLFKEAYLEIPEPTKTFKFNPRGSHHSEHLGYLLADMQIVARSYPDGKW